MVKKKGPKTARGRERRNLTGDGRRSISEHFFPSPLGKKKKRKKS